MSMISEHVKALRDLARINSGDTFNLLWGAANTIEDLSSKVRANNLHGEWIPCSERLPEPDYVKNVIVTMKNGNKNFSTIANYREVMIRGKKIRRWEWNDRVNFPWEVIAWMELPEPYKAGEDNADE